MVIVGYAGIISYVRMYNNYVHIPLYWLRIHIQIA